MLNQPNNVFFIGVIEVYQELCDSQGGKFPAFYSSSGSDPEISQKNCESILKGSTNLDKAISKISSLKEPDYITKSIHYYDTLLYIYTSGTTGNNMYTKHMISFMAH